MSELSGLMAEAARAARSRPRPAVSVLAQGLHPADDALPRRLRLLHLRAAAARRRSRPISRPTRCSRSPAPARRPAAREALFTLGDKPELRYRAAREALAALGYATDGRLPRRDVRAGARETGLLPHAQPRRDDARTSSRALRAVSRVAWDDARDDRRAALRARRPALRLARQGPGACGSRRSRLAGELRDPVHHRHPRRHRRDARGAASTRCSRIARRCTTRTATCRR